MVSTSHHPKSMVRGCILGGGVGDALGAPIEFTTLEMLRRMYGPQGARASKGNHDGPGQFTDDAVVGHGR